MPAFKKDTDKKSSDRKQAAMLTVSAITCPRCSASFVCNAANIQQCQCWGVGLGADDFAYLKQQGFSAEQTGCLCRNCLLEIQREVADAANNSSAT
jgi:hypothetical protein